MVILKYELKRHRTYILGWAIALALCIFLMTPTYYSFLDAASVELFETMGTTDFYRSVGVSMEYLTSPLGIYGFLTSFFMIASGKNVRKEPRNICLQSPFPGKQFIGQRH